MIFIKGKMKKRASNQSEASLIENSLSKSALDRSSRSILDEYQQKFDDNQKVLQGYIDLLKELKEGLSKIGDNVEKQYDWLKNQDFVPSTPGGQEQLEDIGEKLCQTMSDDGNGNTGCNVTLEQLCDITCDQAVVDASCPGYCDNYCQMTCETQCQNTCETTTQNTCPTACEAQCQTIVETYPVEWLDSCEVTKNAALYYCKDPSQDTVPENCTSYGQDDWCGLLESTCGTLGDTLDCVTLGDYSGGSCYDVGETSCAYLGEKYCTASGEQYCNATGELNCLFPGEQHCIFEGEDDWFCNTTVDEYMCDNSADGPDACYDVGEANCKYSGEKYCREPGEKFYCFFYEDNACTSIVDQEKICKYYDDDSTPWCEQAVVDACGIPFKDCLNSAECPPEFGSAAGCDIQGCEASCNDSCDKPCIDICTTSCNEPCLDICTTSCNEGCLKQCNGECNNVCIDKCDAPTCFKTCDAECLSDCNSNCYKGCDKSCEKTCDSSCDSSCFRGCHLCESNCEDCLGSYCDTNCYNGCNNECTGYSCNDTCDINFQCTGCDGTAPCMAACIPSGQGGCSTSDCHYAGEFCDASY
jgi:hypothetical protein